MNRKLQISVLMNTALAVAVFVALRVVVDQRKNIADIRAQTDSTASAFLSDTSPAPSADEAQSSHKSPEVTAALPIPPVPESPRDKPPNPSVELDTLRKQNEGLAGQLLESEAQLAQVKRLIPEPDDPAAAYVGPGTWINPNAQTLGITKIVISAQPAWSPRTGAQEGHVSGMIIAAWGRCSPTDCEWGEVPFFLLDIASSKPTYLRGFAVWEHEGWNRYLIVTFEKSGLKIEGVHLAKQRPIRHRLRTESMTRVN